MVLKKLYYIWRRCKWKELSFINGGAMSLEMEGWGLPWQCTKTIARTVNCSYLLLAEGKKSYWCLAGKERKTYYQLTWDRGAKALKKFTSTMETSFSISKMTKHSMWSWLQPRQIKPVTVNRAACIPDWVEYCSITRESGRVFRDAAVTQLTTTAVPASPLLLSHTLLTT